MIQDGTAHVALRTVARNFGPALGEFGEQQPVGTGWGARVGWQLR